MGPCNTGGEDRDACPYSFMNCSTNCSTERDGTDTTPVPGGRAWAASAAMSRACYAADHGPGTPREAFPAAPVAPAGDDDSGLRQFAVVACRFDVVELLCLHAAGHQRVRLHVAQTPVTWDLLTP